MNTVGYNQALSTGASPEVALYYMFGFFILCVWRSAECSVFISLSVTRPRYIASHWVLFDLFVALLIEVYVEMRDTRAKTSFLSPGQRVWVRNMRTLLSVRLPPPSKPRPTPFAAFNAVRRVVFSVIIHPAFDLFILGVIVVNVVFMCISHVGEDHPWVAAQDVSGAVFSAIFGLEALFKIIALGFRLYFSSWSNRFDFVLAVGSVVAESINLASVGSA